MTRLPQLEAQLVAAAAKRRPRPGLRIAGAAALAVAACIAAALLLAPSSEPQRLDRPVAAPETVPAATLVKARALAHMPVPSRARIPADRVLAEAKRARAQTPYPPRVSDPYDWAKNKWRFRNAFEVHNNVEYIAYCLWIHYWVNGADRAGAGAVLEQYPYWPTRRGKDNSLTYWQTKVLTAVRTRDAATMRSLADGECVRFA